MARRGEGWSRVGWVLVVLPFLFGSIWFGPHLLALYDLESGGRLLEQALQVDGRASAEDPWLLLEPLGRPEARSLAERALVSFQAAVAVDGDNARGYQWLGRANLLLDDPGGAIAAFSEFVRRRPENPLGWWELGLAYERLARGLEGATYLAFASNLDSKADSTATGAAQAITVSLRAAAIQTPDVSIDTPYCEQGEAPESCFVAQTEWEMPDAPDGQPEGWWVPEEPVRRAVLFMHPPSQATFTVTLPVTPTALVFRMGIEPTVWPWLGDGVVYRVWVDGEQVFEHVLTPEAARQGWWPGAVDLSRWAGREVELTLETDPGPAGDGQGDWAGWGEVRLVDAGPADAALADPARRAVAAWREGGIEAWQLLEAGEAARKAERYEEALGWYRRVVWMEPGLGDPWYYAGMAYEGMERWEEALAAYERAVNGRLAEVHRSSPYYRMGVIYRWKVEPRRHEAAWGAFEQALLENDFGSMTEAADCHYQRAYALSEQGVEEDAYLAELRKAIQLNPDHSSAHLLLGVVYYQMGEMELAEREILRAIELDPRNKWGYYHLGELYRKEEDVNQATRMYRLALTLDRNFEEAEARLAELESEGD